VPVALPPARYAAECRRRLDLGRPRPWRRLDVQRPARSLPSSTTVAWNVIARVEFGVVLTPDAEELARADTAARAPRPHVREPMVWSHGFNTRFLNIKRPSLPRITRSLSGGPVLSGNSRAERGTTTSAGNAHPNPQRYPVQTFFGWAETPIHPHPKAHPSPSKTRLDGQSAGHDEMRIVLYVAQTRRYVLLPSKNWRYGACPKNETSRLFFFLGPLAFCSGPIM